MYDYPLDPDWSTEEIIDVVELYNAVEKAFEEASGYSIYKVFKRAQEEEWVKL